MCVYVGCPVICGEESGEASGSWRGVSVGVYGKARESGPHRSLQGMYRQVGLHHPNQLARFDAREIQSRVNLKKLLAIFKCCWFKSYSFANQF